MEDRSASMLELKALRVPHGHYDVAVLGGGLAGLSMALQLKRARPETRVLVTDKRTEPAPEAAFKVGESSVEVGAHYYRDVVGMRDHLEQAQLRKLGLRFFLPAGDNSDITKWSSARPRTSRPSPTTSIADASRTFSGEGMTLAQALEQLPEIEEMDLEARGATVAGVTPAANQRAGS